MYLAFVVAVVATAPLIVGRTEAEWQKIAGIIAGATVVAVMGAIDDKHELKALPQFGAQAVAAIIAMVSGVMIHNVTNPFGTALSNSMLEFPLYFAGALTLFWVVGAMNTINFIDGLDGLAAGITAIAAAVLFAHSFLLTQYTISLLPLALAGAALGFLPHNFFPAKITMGTSGALFLGYGLSCLSIIGGTKAATVLLVLGVPILDAAWIIFMRIWRRQSPFHGDRTHLPHRLAQMGLSQPQIVLLLYSICAIFGILALVLSTRLLKLYAIGGMVILVGGIFALMAQKRFDRVS
jgi:UDP-N-acetylmuramyl pentapeptide phosphotransferase/UDP-N-acetylglucosamine-1-phosphate transferase